MATWLLLASGFGLLLLGADLLVRASASLALRLGVPSLLVGLTLVAWGTSSPELVVSLRAAVRGHPSIALGNVVGSNICNIGLILGVAALIRPLAVQLPLVRRDVPILIVLSAALLPVVRDGSVSRLEGGLLLVAASAYTGFTFAQARGRERQRHQRVLEAARVPERPARRLAHDAILALVGMGALGAGADLFVQGAVATATLLGVSEAVIGLTVVAVGTSLPELATSITAALRDEGDLAIGNTVGSNIFNIVGILGTTAVIHPVATVDIGPGEVAVALGASILLLPLLVTGFRLVRWEGALLLACYGLYVYSLVP